jgi:hypothetical protein
MTIGQPRRESGNSGSIRSPQLVAANGGDSVPDPLDTPVKMSTVALGYRCGESGCDDSVDSPQIFTANGGDSVPDPLSTLVKTPPMAISQPHGALSSVAAPPELSAVVLGSMLDVCDGTGPVAKPCQSAFPAEGRTRGRRAGRRHPPPERLAQLRGACLLRLISASR